MGAGALGPSGADGGPMMKVPMASGGLTPAQPWTGTDMWRPGATGSMPMPRQPTGVQDPWTPGATGTMPPQRGAGGGASTWRQATQPFGLLMPMLLPGMLAQRAQQTAAPAPQPAGPVSGGTGTYAGTSTGAAAAQPQGPRDPLADFWASFNYGSSSV